MLSLLLVVLAACDEQPKAADTTVHPRASATASSTATAAPKPKPLSVAPLSKALKCRPKSDGPCAVLAQFHDCTKFNPVTQSGDGRWIGRGYQVKAGAFVEQFTLLRSRRVALDQVAPGQLGAKVAIARVPEDRPTVLTNAAKAVHALQRNDVPKQLNAAVKYVKERREWTESYSMQSDQNEIYVGAAGGAYLCAMSDQRLLLVKRDTASASAGDGLYAELWPISW